MFLLGILGVGLTIVLLNTSATRYTIPSPDSAPAFVPSPSPVTLQITVSRDQETDDPVITVEELPPPDVPAPDPDVPTPTPVSIAIDVVEDGEAVSILVRPDPASTPETSQAVPTPTPLLVATVVLPGGPTQAGQQASSQADHRHCYAHPHGCARA